jgi:glutamine synthetase
MERYCKDVNTEGLTCLTMAKTLILPAAARYQAELAKDAMALKAVGKPAPASLDTVSSMVTQLEERIGKLTAAMNHHGAKDIMAEAKHFRDDVLPAMLAIREVSDQLEETIADDLWPLPRYREMLFIK